MSLMHLKRFWLAHELGHRVLHREILGAMEFKTIEEWCFKLLGKRPR